MIRSSERLKKIEFHLIAPHQPTPMASPFASEKACQMMVRDAGRALGNADKDAVLEAAVEPTSLVVGKGREGVPLCWCS